MASWRCTRPQSWSQNGSAEGGLESVEVVRSPFAAHLDDEGTGTRRLARGNQVVVGGGVSAGQRRYEPGR